MNYFLNQSLSGTLFKLLKTRRHDWRWEGEPLPQGHAGEGRGEIRCYPEYLSPILGAWLWVLVPLSITASESVASWEAASHCSDTQVLVTHRYDLDGVPGSWLHTGMVFVGI